MSKKDIQHTNLTPIETALQEQFKNLSRAEIAAAFADVETTREDWLYKAITFGMGALAMKPKIGHGKFKEWLQEALKMATRGHFEAESYRTARRYMCLTRKVLKQIEAPSEKSTFGAKLLEYASENGIEAANFSVILQNGIRTQHLVKTLVSGYSLRSLTSALAEVNSDALAEEESEKAAEKLTAKNGSLKGLKGEAAAPQDPQMMLWDDWTNEFENIEKLIRHNQAARLDPEKWLAIENTLEAQLEEIRKITAGFKAGLAKKRK